MTLVSQVELNELRHTGGQTVPDSSVKVGQFGNECAFTAPGDPDQSNNGIIGPSKMLSLTESFHPLQ